eukprot:tig00000342_g24190.t1
MPSVMYGTGMYVPMRRRIAGHALDWFTGLVPAYAKKGFFGDTFNGTTFMHIVHNLEPSYEGRVYIDANESRLGDIHGLEEWLLIDPKWEGIVINPCPPRSAPAPPRPRAAACP